VSKLNPEKFYETYSRIVTACELLAIIILALRRGCYHKTGHDLLGQYVVFNASD
jgi:hypothetical protein